jgi:AmmeMemoRadiSam system protein B
MVLRKAAVAGRFYPSNQESLREEISSYLGTPQPKIQARGIVVPHAGYMYSGHVAGAVFSKIILPARCIILCPNHTGLGAPLSIMCSGQWEIPFGKIEIDAELANKLTRHCHLLTENAEAHKFEHSLEVQLPFLHYLNPDFKFVPITVGSVGFASLESLGKGIAETLKELNEEVLVIASSDMNHYEPDDVTRGKDHLAIGRILALDPKGLYDTVKANFISMCGYGPTIAMLYGIQTGQPLKAELVKYATSGDINQDWREVVGYAGIAVSTA